VKIAAGGKSPIRLGLQRRFLFWRRRWPPAANQ
jgi:hypothetical protein